MKFTVVSAFLSLITSVLAISNQEKWATYASDINGGGEDADKAIKAVIREFPSNHHSSFVAGLDAEGARRLFLAVVKGNTKVDDISNYVSGTGTASNWSKIGKNFSTDDVKNMPKEVCEVFINALEHWSYAKHINADCYKAYLESLGDRTVRITTAGGIPASWITDNGAKVAKAIAKADSDKDLDLKKNKLAISQLSSETFKALVAKNKENDSTLCDLFDATLIDNVKNSEYRKRISPACLNSLKNIGDTDINSVRDLDDKVFSEYNGSLTTKTIGKLRPQQLQYFGSKVEGSDGICSNLELTSATTAAMALISKDCLQGFLNGKNGTESGKLLAHAPLSAFKGWKGQELEVFGHISVDDYKYLSSDVLQFIIDSDAVEYLPQEKSNPKIINDSTAKGVKVTATTFERLANRCPSIASLILIHADVPSNVLSKCEPDTILSLSGMKNKELVEGYEFFDSYEDKISNFGEIVSRMGDNAKEHICSKIDDVESYLSDMGWLRANPGRECKKHLPFAGKAETLKRAPELALTVDNIWIPILEEAKDDADYWAKKTKTGDFDIYAQQTNFCRAIASTKYKHLFKKFTSSQLVKIGGRCAIVLKALIDEKMAPKLSDTAFSMYKAADFKFPFKLLKSSQIPYISVGLSNAEKTEHVFFQVKSSQLETLDSEQLVLVTAKQWGLVSPQEISYINAARIQLIPAANLTRITSDQLKALSTDTIKALSPEQIRMIGKDVDNDLKAINNVLSRLNNSQVDAYHVRVPSSSSSDDSTSTDGKVETEQTGLSITSWILVVGGIVLVIGAGAATFLILNQSKP